MGDVFPIKRLPDGRVLTVVPLTFGRARLCAHPPGDHYSFADLW